MTIFQNRNHSHKDIPPALQTRLRSISMVCPLCSTTMVARGIRPQPDPGLPVEHWEVVFICPACGLLTTFDARNFSPRLVKAIPGTQWTTRLRHYSAQAQVEEIEHERNATRFHFISVLVISFITWIILTGSFNIIDLGWGAVMSLIVARFSYRLVAFNLPTWVTSPRRWAAFLELLAEFARQLIVQNVTLSLRVLKPKIPIRPGIVAIPTKLRSDIALTILGSLITLTPDTVTMDIDQRKGIIYVHWIDMKSTDPDISRKLISAAFEEKIIRWLE